MGYLLASPLRRWGMQDPEKLLGPWIQPGFTVLEPGPGMGFFTLPMAKMVGSLGSIVSLDVQPQMLAGLRRRAERARLADRLDLRLVGNDSLGIGDLAGSVDFVLAFAVVHEMPSAEKFFVETALALKPGGHLYFAEPAGHVTDAGFQVELEAAYRAGLKLHVAPKVRRSHAAILHKP
jgi:SAM-dependent methyltransferase